MITTNNVAYTTAGFTSRQKGVNTIIGCPKLVLFRWSSKFRDDNWTTDWLRLVSSASHSVAKGRITQYVLRNDGASRGSWQISPLFSTESLKIVFLGLNFKQAGISVERIVAIARQNKSLDKRNKGYLQAHKSTTVFQRKIEFSGGRGLK
jgi:hypothetical protein